MFALMELTSHRLHTCRRAGIFTDVAIAKKSVLVCEIGENAYVVI